MPSRPTNFPPSWKRWYHRPPRICLRRRRISTTISNSRGNRRIQHVNTYKTIPVNKYSEKCSIQSIFFCLGCTRPNCTNSQWRQRAEAISHQTSEQASCMMQFQDDITACRLRSQETHCACSSSPQIALSSKDWFEPLMMTHSPCSIAPSTTLIPTPGEPPMMRIRDPRSLLVCFNADIALK